MLVPYFVLLFSVAAGQSIGDIRLVGGSGDYEGRVEVLYDFYYVSGVPTYSWGTVCDDSWSSTDAQVVCRQLGYSTSGATAFSSAHFGQGSGTIYLDNVECTGYEARLLDCSYDPDTSDCNHYEDAGVACTPTNNIRLVGGSVDWEGRVEVYTSGQWGTVCDDWWDSNDAQVVCRQLGYSAIGAIAYCCAHFGQGYGAIHMRDVGCSGSESALLQCWYAYPYSCGHYEDAGVACQPFTCQDGDVRLAGGEGQSGRVEVCLNQRWGTVCDNGWSISDAGVVCKQLGFVTTGLSHYVSAYFGQGTGPVLLSDLTCTGSEDRLIDCSYSNINSCTHSQDAGVDCQLSAIVSEGDIRLVGGSNSWEGRVEIYISGVWGTIDDDPWTTDNAQVVCRQLGYLDQGAVAFSNAYFGGGTGPIHIDEVSCTGIEFRLLDCFYASQTGEDSHSEDVGVRCQPDTCQNGDVRLVGGETEREGRVQLCLYGRWGSVCDHQWSVADAGVVCAQFGYYPFDFVNYSTSSIPELHGPIFLDNVNCSGSEESLIDCNFDYLANRCTHAQDVAVFCKPTQCAGEIQLVDGGTEREGRLEVCFDQGWGTVCDEGWSPIDSQVVCKQLGYSTSGSVSRHFSPGNFPIRMTSVNCDGSELRLVNCSYISSTSICSHSNDVGVHCQPAPCEDGDIQLVDGGEEWEGILQICFNQRWGTVSGEGWTSTETDVVCRELGYQSTGAAYQTSVSGTGPVFMSSVRCSGSEIRLLDCGYKTIPSANHSIDVSVSCSPVSCVDGDIRLVGGETEREGRVEVCLDQRWGTVNGDGWSSVDAQVVCRQLGYSTASFLSSSNKGTGPIVMDNVGCYGWETRLIDCSHNKETGEDTHDEDVAVRCLPAVPPAPISISVVSLSSTSLRLQWPPLDPVTVEYGTILQYSVICSATILYGDHQVETVQRSITQFDMTALQPYTTYNCCVSAENIAGNGVPICSDGNTLEDVPSGAPMELVATPMNSRSLLLTWSPPLEAERNGVIRIYHVNLTEEETGTVFHFETELTTLSQPSLHPFYHYSCVVAAFTVGVGPYSSPLTVQMPEDIPSGSPRIMAALRTGPTAMEVAFTPVSIQESNGIITAYLVTSYLNSRNTGCQSPVTTMAPANATVAVIEGLDPSQEYCVTVAARTSVGIGESSQVVTVGLFSSVIIQVQLLGGPPCTWSLVTQDSAPVLATVSESLLFSVNSDCSSRCSLAASNIRDSRLICCEEQKDEVVFQAIIYDIDSSELENYLQKWVDSQPQIRGWNTLLNVSTSWQYGLSDDAFLDSEAKCDKVQSSQCSLSSSSNSGSSASAVALGVILALVLVLFILLLVAVGIAILWYRKRYKKAVIEDSVVFQQLQLSSDESSQTAQATPPPAATPSKQPEVTKHEVESEKKFNPFPTEDTNTGTD